MEVKREVEVFLTFPDRLALNWNRQYTLWNKTAPTMLTMSRDSAVPQNICNHRTS